MRRSGAAVLVACSSLVVPAAALAEASFEIVVVDAPGTGFDDMTQVAAVGGNGATTLGAQRLAALERAAELWGAALDSDVPIVIEASFSPMGCDERGGVAAVGGTVFLNTGIDGDGGDPTLVYGSALADRLMGEDQQPGEPDVTVSFNSDLGGSECPDTRWYYGLDGGSSVDLDMVDIALHELGHGLGVQHFVADLAIPDAGVEAGDESLGIPDVFEAHVLDLDLDQRWDELDSAGRAASSENVRRLVWDGAHVQAAAAEWLEPGMPTLGTTPALGLSGLLGDAVFGARPLAMSVSAPLRLGEPMDGCGRPGAVGGAVVLLRPQCLFSAVASELERAGALAVLMAVDPDDALPPASLEEVEPFASDIPVLSIPERDAALLESALETMAVTVEIGADAERLIGADPQGRPFLYAASPVTRGNVGHFDPLARPNLLMEPVRRPLATHELDLTRALLRDIGWEPFCGNGRIDQQEACDDGDDNSDLLPDACRTRCVAASCGDAVVDQGEVCDEGEGNSDELPDRCRLDCQPAHCGDGVTDEGEACDDGEANSDALPNACRASCVLPACGDGVTDEGEACDDGEGNSDGTPDACRTDCAAAGCGDGVVDTGEACDDGADNSDTRPDACRSNCVLPTCGDGVTDEGEVCDGGADSSDELPDACRSDCTEARCGDGVIDRGEQCDGEPGCEQCLMPGFERTADGGIVEEKMMDGGGCGCRVPGAPGGERGPTAPLALALGVLGLARRRRRASRALLLAALALLALPLIGCDGDEGGDGTRRARSGSSGTAGDGDADPMDGGVDDGTGLGFGNADAQPPMLEPPDGGFPDAMAAIGDGDDPDDDSCGSVELEPMANAVVEPGNLLVVFDNSGSMGSVWNGSPRWQVAGNAVRDAVSSLSEFLTVAAIIFPAGNLGGCLVPSIDSDEQIRFLPGPTFVAAWDNWMAQNAPNGGTPLGGGLDAADQALQMSMLTGATNVIVLTDGAPTCGSTSLMTLPPMWLMQGIRTHVVGLPGSESAETTLDALAMAGGTMQHLQPGDSRALRRQLAGIISETVSSALASCTIPLDPAAPNPDDVHVVITENGMRSSADRDLGEGGGWRIDDAGTEIEFFGTFCDKGLAGDYDRISIELGCVDLPPLEPPVLD